MVFWDFTAVFSPRAANEFENNFVRALVLSGILSLYWDTELHNYVFAYTGILSYLPILSLYWDTELFETLSWRVLLTAVSLYWDTEPFGQNAG